jgi:hypothetical protein
MLVIPEVCLKTSGVFWNGSLLEAQQPEEVIFFSFLCSFLFLAQGFSFFDVRNVCDEVDLRKKR